MSTPQRNIAPISGNTGGRFSVVGVLIFVGLCIFALAVGWNGILHPPPKLTAEQLHQANLEEQAVERQLSDAVRQSKVGSAHDLSTPPVTSPGVHSLSPPGLSAKEKYALASNYPPNWATQECVDIIVRYPDSPEAAFAADILVDNWDHILYRDFVTLTNLRLPVDDYTNMPQKETVEMLRVAFHNRGIHPTR